MLKQLVLILVAASLVVGCAHNRSSGGAGDSSSMGSGSSQDSSANGTASQGSSKGSTGPPPVPGYF